MVDPTSHRTRSLNEEQINNRGYEGYNDTKINKLLAQNGGRELVGKEPFKVTQYKITSADKEYGKHERKGRSHPEMKMRGRSKGRGLVRVPRSLADVRS